MLKVRIVEDCGFCDGLRVQTGDVVELTDTAAADFINQGKAVPVDEPEPAKTKAEAEEVETAEVRAPENAARRVAKPRARKAP